MPGASAHGIHRMMLRSTGVHNGRLRAQGVAPVTTVAVAPPLATTEEGPAQPRSILRCTLGYMDTVRAAYDELYVYTMGRPRFILQHVVDAFAAQIADEDSKPIGVVFALVGLYLHVEKQSDGRQVQRVHMHLGRRKRDWPIVNLPGNRGRMTASDVLAAPAGAERDKAIDDWCQCVWAAFSGNRPMVIALLREHQID